VQLGFRFHKFAIIHHHTLTVLEYISLFLSVGTLLCCIDTAVFHLTKLDIAILSSDYLHGGERERETLHEKRRRKKKEEKKEEHNKVCVCYLGIQS
jgi:hypothetical protein